MEVDTNELLHRIGAVLRVISDKMDRLIEAANDHFAGADKMVADEPANEVEPEYREPVLPADAGKVCEFSDDGQRWLSGWVYGWVPGRNWVTLHNSSWKHARIKKDA